MTLKQDTGIPQRAAQFQLYLERRNHIRRFHADYMYGLGCKDFRSSNSIAPPDAFCTGTRDMGDCTIAKDPIRRSLQLTVT